MPSQPVGSLLRHWRQRRNLSQLDLATDAGVSARHLSFVETGRARPSPELLLMLADRLEVPLRERNSWLLAAGYAPRYAETGLSEPAMARVRASLQRMLDSHDPYPGVAIDRAWNVVLANQAAVLMTHGLPDHVTGPTLNVFRLCLHPDGLARRTLNFPEWSHHLLDQLHRSVAVSADPELQSIADEVATYPNLADVAGLHNPRPSDEPALLIPLRLSLDGVEVSLFTTVTTFGTPQDVTLSELAVELFYPADDVSEELLQRAHDAAGSLPKT